jgi:type IV pilus assembly protein PilE
MVANSIRKTIMKHCHRAGFTLIELLIALVIIGILTAYAYPSYLQYILKTHRTDALSALTQDQIILERCYAQNFAYNGTCGALPAFPQTSSQGYYSIMLSNLGANTYTLSATPVGQQVKDTTCASFTVTQANVKTATNNTGGSQTNCWNP